MSGPDFEDVEVEEAPPAIEGVFTDLARAIIEPPRWLIEGLIPVGLSTIIGPPKLSEKSTLAMAATCLVAEIPVPVLPDWLSVVERAGPVLVFSSEATAGELRDMTERGMLAKLKDGAILVADDPGDWRLDDPDGSARLMNWIHKLRPRMVVIDVLRDFHELDEKESAGLNLMLRPIRKWAKDEECGVLVVHHTRKLAEGATEYNAEDSRGSSAFFAMVDGMLVISPKEDGTKKVKGIFKRAPRWEYHLQFGTWGKPGIEVLSADDRQVQKAIADGAKTAEDIAQVMKRRKEDILRIVAKLKRNNMLPKKAG